MNQETAIHGVALLDQLGYVLENLAGLLLGLEVVSWRKFHKISWGGAERVASVAPGVARTIL